MLRRMMVLIPLFLFAFVSLTRAQGITPPLSTTPVPGSAETLVVNTPRIITLSGDAAELHYAGASGEVLTITARSLEPEGVLDTTLEVLTLTNSRLAYNDDYAGTDLNLTRYDSAVVNFRFASNGGVIIRVDSFDDAGSGQVEVLVSNGGPIQPVEPTEVPVTPEAPVTPDIPVTPGSTDGVITGVVPNNAAFEHTLSAQAGDVLTITVRAMDNVLDPKVTLFNPGGNVVASNDDHGTNEPSLERFDSRISDFTVTETGNYLLQITGFGGSGGAFELTIEQSGGEAIPTPIPTATVVITPTVVPNTGSTETVEGTIRANEIFTYDLDAEAGDVVTITVRTIQPSDLDPQVSVYDSDETFIFANDDHGSSEQDMALLDSRISNLILPETGRYILVVAGYQDTAGDFEMTIERVATGAPLGNGTDQVFNGEVRTNGTFTQTFDAQAGDYVTITVRANEESFDPRIQLLSLDGVILTDNDDHSSSVSLGPLDSRIQNFRITETGTYRLEIQGYRASAGTFKLTITTLR